MSISNAMDNVSSREALEEKVEKTVLEKLKELHPEVDWFVDITMLFNEAWKQCYKGGGVSKVELAKEFNIFVNLINYLNNLNYDEVRFEEWNRDLDKVMVKEEIKFLIQPRRIRLNPGLAASANLKPHIWYFIKDFIEPRYGEFVWDDACPSHLKFIEAVTDWNNRFYGVKSEEESHTVSFVNEWKDSALNDDTDRLAIITEGSHIRVLPYESQKSWPIFIDGRTWMRQVYRNFNYWSSDWKDWFELFLEFTKPKFK